MSQREDEERLAGARRVLFFGSAIAVALVLAALIGR